MKITDVKVRLYKEEGSLKGFANVELDEELVLTGIKIIESSKGMFLGMPATKGTDKKGDEAYFDIFYPCTKEFREKLTDAVLDAYDEEVDQGSKKRKNKR